MKNRLILGLCLSPFFFGCAHKAPTPRAPEVVASCFSDGEDQEQICKTKRIDESSRIVITRCIGSANKIAPAALRGQCVEKICVANSNTECIVRGEFAVLQTYAELMRDRLFAEDQDSPAPPAGKMSKKKKGKKTSRHTATTNEIDVDPGVRLPPEPVKNEPMPQAPVVKSAPAAEGFTAEPPEMKVTLKPDKPLAMSKTKSRTPASVAPPAGFKRVCISKNDTRAPAVLRGKCAVRNCTDGKCSYKGRKEMFEWAAR